MMKLNGSDVIMMLNGNQITLIPPSNQAQSLSLGAFDLFQPATAPDTWVASGGSGEILNMNSTQFLSTFYDPYIGNGSNGMTVTKTSLGKDQSGTYDIYEYDFCPVGHTSSKPTILITSGIHGIELSSIFGAAFFVKDLMDTTIDHIGFRYIRQNVRVKIIPIANPWGFNQSPSKSYANSRGVNPIRNFDYNGAWAAYPVYGDVYNNKGTAPYSEAETAILRDWALANSSARVWIDCHTGYGTTIVDNYIYYQSNDPLKTRLLSTLARLEKRIATKYSVTPTKTVVIDSVDSIRNQWAVGQLNMSSFSLEQSPRNTLWGTATNNEGGDITEFEAALCAYVFTYVAQCPVLYTTYTTTNVYTTDEVSITYNVSDIEGGTLTATYTVDGVSTTATVSSGGNTWNAGTLAEGSHTLSIAVANGSGLTSNALEFSLTASVLETQTTIASDAFVRSNGALGTTEVGNLTWVDTSGTCVISSNAAKFSTLTASIGAETLNIGVSNYEISCDITWSSYAGLWLKYQDVNNFISARINSTSLSLVTNVSGTTTTIGTYTFTPVVGNTYAIKAIVDGTSIKVYLDGTLRIDQTTNVLLTNTVVGLRAFNDTVSKFDNFVLKTVA